jgi:hypothetical protein
MKRKRLPPKLPSPPPGWMYWHGELTKITTVEQHAKDIIGNHDKLPRAQRDLANEIVRHFTLSKEGRRR